ncbi:MAG: TonB-dependent receptor plug domain-containing protein [Candidatus Cyclobacteriaceae bacterium M3_2C_046]
MLKKLTIWIILSCGCISIQAQEMKSISLEEVTIKGIPLEKYAAGSKIVTIDSLTKKGYQHTTLSDLIQQNSALYLKEYGHGMLSSVSFRGTGASHTAVLWNGININSLTLGNLDFSLVPLIAVDQVEIQHGSASSLYGSDAIGGSIHLSSTPNWEKGTQLTLQQEYGSFQTWFSGLTLKMGNKKLSAETKIYRKQSQNDFRFQNFTQLDAPVQQQNNAAFHYHGILQELSYRITPTQSVSLNGWYNQNFREIQPAMSANQSISSFETLYDRNFRIVADYMNHAAWGFMNVKMAYINDLQNFNDLSHIGTYRYVSSFEYEKDLGDKVVVKAGSKWNSIHTRVEAYQDDLVENRYDLFLSANYWAMPWWKFTFNMRRTFIQGYKSPFTPSLGSNLQIISQAQHQLKLKTLLSRGYRIPTLNDRFWPLSGNPDLLPEHSFSGESGLSYRFSGNRWQFDLESTFYTMKVDDMITWVPAGVFWRPENVQQTRVKGVEFHSSLDKKITHTLSLGITGNYAYTSSVSEKDPEYQGNQLAYTPVHQANMTIRVNYNKWQGSLTNDFTGQRFTSLSNQQALPAYLLTNMNISHDLNILNTACTFSLRLNNLFDVDYQNLQYLAMPGLNWQVGLNLIVD